MGRMGWIRRSRFEPLVPLNVDGGVWAGASWAGGRLGWTFAPLAPEVQVLQPVPAPHVPLAQPPVGQPPEQALPQVPHDPQVPQLLHPQAGAHVLQGAL